MKLHPVGGELFHADRKTDRPLAMTRLISLFTIFRTCLKTDPSYQQAMEHNSSHYRSDTQTFVTKPKNHLNTYN